MSKQLLYLAKRENLERLANYLHLTTDPSWSQGHLARLVWWRIKRRPIHW